MKVSLRVSGKNCWWRNMNLPKVRSAPGNETVPPIELKLPLDGKSRLLRESWDQSPRTSSIT